MTHDDLSHDDTEDRYYAQFDSREVKLMTLDELDEAFNAGHIHENTFVCREGESEWLTLAIVAGIGQDEEEPEPAPVVERRPPMPGARAHETAAERRPPMPGTRVEAAAVERRPPMPTAGDRRPPMPARGAQPVSAYPSLAPAAPIAASTPLSFAPVTSTIQYQDSDTDEFALRPKRRIGLMVAIAVGLALAGAGTVFALNGGRSAIASAMPSGASLQAAGANTQASLTLSKIEAKPSAAVAPTPAPEPAPAPAPAETAAPTDGSKAGFSDDMKQALLNADKEHKVKTSQKRRGGATHAAAPAAHRGRAASNSTGFKSGGSAYDPLNGKL